MARKKSKKSSKKTDKKNDEQSEYNALGIKPHTQRSIIAITFFVLAIFLSLSALGLAGRAGGFVHEYFSELLFGHGFVLLIIFLVTFGVFHVKQIIPKVGIKHWLSGALFVVGILGLLDLFFGTSTGGVIGRIAIPIEKLFDVYVGALLLITMIIVSFLVLFEKQLAIPTFFKNLFKKNDAVSSAQAGAFEHDVEVEVSKEVTAAATASVDEASAEDDAADEDESSKKGLGIFSRNKKKEDLSATNAQAGEIEINDTRIASSYTPPPLSLLGKKGGKPDTGDIKANANIIKRTLHNFNIDVEMDEISVGPTVTRFALKPAQGVKLARIIGLQNELALALAAHPVRIEAPIPGTSLVGIEVPNKTKAMVGLRDIISDPVYDKSTKPLLAGLGKSVSGSTHFANIAKMPHLLIAGATGSGKSVTVHNLIVSLLYRNGPQDLRFIMVDPKRVELTLYNKIPHLLTPVIKDPKKAILALKWACKEMDRRYDILESESVRDIQSYHSTVVKPAYDEAEKNGTKEDEDTSLPERMPYIVIIIDELADIMQTYPRELEAGIVRLAQMSRAVGIHLILSTQRPSVNVITGLIKANIPARIALQVSSQVDSRTILDTSGAEKLLGAGDMLYAGGEMSKAQRMQSAFISESEVKKIAEYLGKQGLEDIPDAIDLSESEHDTSPNSIFSSTMDDGDEEDELYEDAKRTVIEADKGSTSYLQRKLRVGYSRAARLMDILEERGIVGPPDGSKPREVLVGDTEDVDMDSAEDQDAYDEEDDEA